MRFARLVDVSGQVAATRSRLTKRDLIAAVLAEAAAAGPDEVELAATYLAGSLRQRRTGIGWRALADLPAAAAAAELSLLDVDRMLDRIAGLSGPGSTAVRRQLLDALFARLTAPEQRFLAGVISGNVRQGALDSVMLDAIAAAARVPLPAVRRAAMFSGPTGPIAVAALAGGAAALERFTLRVGRPVRPMLAASAPDLPAAMTKAAATASGGTDASPAREDHEAPGGFAVDSKLDGIRIQVHKQVDEVLVFTRSLEEISTRLPEVVAATRTLPVRDVVLDGEALALDEAGRPLPFQDTAATTALRSGGNGIRPFFFDVLLHEERALIEAPLRQRLAVLDAVVPAPLRVPRLATSDPDAAARFFAEVLAHGHEGVIVKRLDAPYEAGRRGSAWVKVKPRHTLDLVVLAVEEGSGRRAGLLSNIHLGARDPATGGFVMLGKTFKGMTDEMLAWQTERFRGLETGRSGAVVHLRPEQVVEVAFDGVQRSPRYPGGVALRFARVLRYRDDKPVEEIDTIETVRSLGRVGGSSAVGSGPEPVSEKARP